MCSLNTILFQGDTDKSVSAKASYFLLQLLQQHPQMKAVVVREVSALILRPVPSSSSSGASLSSATATLHARYYGILTFNQIVLTPRERDVAQLLTTLYFELFVMILGSPTAAEEAEMDDADDEGGSADKKNTAESKRKKKSGRRAPLPRDRRKLKERAEKDGKKGAGTGVVADVHVGDAGFGEVEDGHSKMIAGILTGLNRALPFAKMEETMYVSWTKLDVAKQGPKARFLSSFSDLSSTSTPCSASPTPRRSTSAFRPWS